MIKFSTLVLVLMAVTAFLLLRRAPSLFGPVLFYDFVRTSRRGRHLVLRCLFASGLFVLVYVSYDQWFFHHGAEEWKLFDKVSASPDKLARFGESLFSSFMVLQFAVVFLLTPAYTAGAIAEEKERRTLEFLLATDLHDHEIILSKLLSRLVTMLLLLLTGLPFLSFLQLLGGVDPNLALAGYAAAGLSAVSLASLSILVSVHSKNSLNAIAGTYALVVLYLLVSSCLPVLNWGNIFTAIFRIDFDSNSVNSRGDNVYLVLIEYTIFHVLASLTCIATATENLRRTSLGTNAFRFSNSRKPAEIQPDVKTQSATEMNPDAPEPFRAPWKRGEVLPKIMDQPMRWKECHLGEENFFDKSDWMKAREVMCFVVIFCIFNMLFLAVITGKLRNDTATHVFGAFGSAIASFMFLIIGLSAAGRVSKEREQNTLDSLLATQLDREEILWAKLLGSIRSVRKLWWMLGPIWILGVLSEGLNILALPLLIFAWLVFAGFSACLGLYYSTICRSTTQARSVILAILVAINVAPLFVSSLSLLSPAVIFWRLFLGNASIFDNRHGADFIVERMIVGLLILAVYICATDFLWNMSFRKLCSEEVK